MEKHEIQKRETTTKNNNLNVDRRTLTADEAGGRWRKTSEISNKNVNKQYLINKRQN